MRRKKTDDYLDELNEVFESNEAFDLERRVANMELIVILSRYLADHKTLRFGQALRNLGIVADTGVTENHSPLWKNEFSTEPTKMLKRVQEQLKKLNWQP